jgi:hypothetical protein
MRTWVLLLVAAATLATSMTALGAGRVAKRVAANQTPWHKGYYDPAWGQPHALVVPPTVDAQTKYSWGVANTERSVITHQFRRRYPGGFGAGQYGFMPTPAQPWHTDQFGTYYVRGPWK